MSWRSYNWAKLNLTGLLAGVLAITVYFHPKLYFTNNSADKTTLTIKFYWFEYLFLIIECKHLKYILSWCVARGWNKHGGGEGGGGMRKEKEW